MFGGEKRVKIKFLRGEADQSPGLTVFRANVVAEDPDFTFLEIRQARDGIDGCRLAGAVRPEKTEEVPLLDLKGDPVQRLKAPVKLGQGLNRNRRNHWRLFYPMLRD